MNPYEVYRLNNALRLHFTQDKYDFFKNGTYNRSCAPEYFERMSDAEKHIFNEVSQMREPKTYLIGNYIFNKTKHIRSFNSDHYLKYRECNTNGKYILEQDLKHFRTPFGNNFKVEDEEFPYIINIHMREKITLFTLCVMEKLTDWSSKTPVNILTQNTLRDVRKSLKFFKINEKSYKEIIIKHYK